MNWDEIVEHVAPHVVKLETPNGFGTGFVCLYNQSKSMCGIATAAHVVSYANDWEQPIRIRHHSSGKSVLIKENERIVMVDEASDSALVMFSSSALDLPAVPLSLLPHDKHLSIGMNIGWLGFPGIDSETLCFFSGSISAHKQKQKYASYLIDGVAINGVSGGPVFFSSETAGVQVVGTVSGYMPNRATGDSLPGLLVAQDVSHFHEVARFIKSVDEERKKKDESEKSGETSLAANQR